MGTAVLVGVLASALAGLFHRDRPATTTLPVRLVATTVRTPRPRPRVPRQLVEHPRGLLRVPVEDAAAAPLGDGRVMLLGGLSSADRSVADIHTVDMRGTDRSFGSLPIAVHDAAAAHIGPSVYVFGGGTNTGAQSDSIVRVNVAGGATTIVGRLPAPSSDQSAATIGGIAYIVGGYTGSRWLNTIVAWKPGSAARVVARLPFAVRYAAVAATRDSVVISGGSLADGAASAAVLVFTPGHGVRRIGRLPAPTTHAAAAALGDIVYVIGGRGAALGSVTGSIASVDPRSGTIRDAGSLRVARSDLSAAAVAGRILVAGGHGEAGVIGTLGDLVPTTVRKAQSIANPASVYAFDGVGQLTGPARFAKPLVYVPNSQSGSVDVIDPHTYKVVHQFAVGQLPQHVVPSYDLSTLYVTNDVGNSLTVIDPRTGRPGRTIPVSDPYNMYFTPDGSYAVVVAEREHHLDFRDARTFALHRTVSVPCSGVDHMDYSADGSYLIASCEFSGQLVKVDVQTERVVGVLDLPDGRAGMPQDVRISPRGDVFYVADLRAGGVWRVDGRSLKVLGLIRTGAGAHGLYPSRDGRELYVSNRDEGSVSVISFRTQRVVTKWLIPGGGSPDMGGVSADGKVLWLSGRFNSDVYAISTTNGRLLARIPVGSGPHGLCVWPQPGRYSLGHTDNMR